MGESNRNNRIPGASPQASGTVTGKHAKGINMILDSKYGTICILE
jgi:hypothetical protein